MKNIIRIMGLTALLCSLQSCEVFTKSVAPGLVYGDWVGNWSNTTDPNNDVFALLTFKLKKNQEDTNNLFMTITSKAGKVSKEYEAQLESLDRSDAKNVGFKLNGAAFFDEVNLGRLKFIKYLTRIREADKKLFLEVSYLDADLNLYDPIYWKTKTYEFILK